MDHEADATRAVSRKESGEPTDEYRWLTYDDLGRIRGISRESAVKLAQRKRWRRIPGNDGVARVSVPTEWLATTKEPSGAHSPPRALDPSPHLQRLIEMLEGVLAQLRTRAEADATQIAHLLAAVERAEQRQDAERARADALRDRIESLQAHLAAVDAEAKAAHGRAWSSGELAGTLREELAAAERRIAAEGDRADRAESRSAHEHDDLLDVESRAQRSEEARDIAERERDDLRTEHSRSEERAGRAENQVFELKGALAAAHAAAEQATHEAQEARQVAQVILQDDAARRRLSLPARLRAAWRGE